MKIAAAFVLLAIVGLVAAQTQATVDEAAHQNVNRTSRLLDFPDPVMKLFKPSITQAVTQYGTKALQWFQSVEKSALAAPPLILGIVGLSISFVITSIIWAIVYGFKWDKNLINKWVKPVVSTLNAPHPKPFRGSRVLDLDIHEVTTQVYEAIDKFLDDKKNH